MTDKPTIVLTALAKRAQTPDEFVSERGWYINSWAPTFTTLRQAGLVRRTGEKRNTSHGAEAYVIEITERGHMWLQTAATVTP